MGPDMIASSTLAICHISQNTHTLGFGLVCLVQLEQNFMTFSKVAYCIDLHQKLSAFSYKTHK